MKPNKAFPAQPAPLPPAYPLALLATWIIHDAEELLDLGTFRLPLLGRPLDANAKAHLRRAVTVMGGLVLGVSLLGVSSSGRHPLFRAANRANLAHALWHLAASALLRRPTPGVRSAAALVLPTALLTEHALVRAGHQVPPVRALLLFPAALTTAHAAAWAWKRTSDRRR